MKTNEMFAGSFITAKNDLFVNNSKVQLNLQIADCTTEAIGEDNKFVLSFSNHDKSLVLNKTNFNTLMEMYPASDTDSWKGRWITLVAQETEYQGKRVWGTRISLDVPDTDAINAALESAAIEDGDEIIPF